MNLYWFGLLGSLANGYSSVPAGSIKEIFPAGVFFASRFLSVGVACDLVAVNLESGAPALFISAPDVGPRSADYPVPVRDSSSDEIWVTYFTLFNPPPLNNYLILIETFDRSFFTLVYKALWPIKSNWEKASSIKVKRGCSWTILK